MTGQKLTLAMYAVDAERGGSKAIVFGSGDIITNEGAGSAYFINPLQLFLTSITWMYNSDVDMNIANKSRTFDSLNVTSSSEASALMGVFIGFPILIVVIGVAVWLRRKDG